MMVLALIKFLVPYFSRYDCKGTTPCNLETMPLYGVLQYLTERGRSRYAILLSSPLTIMPRP